MDKEKVHLKNKLMMMNSKKFKLKYLVLFFALASIGLTACQKEDPLEPDPTITPKQTPDDSGNSRSNKVDKTIHAVIQDDQVKDKK